MSDQIRKYEALCGMAEWARVMDMQEVHQYLFDLADTLWNSLTPKDIKKLRNPPPLPSNTVESFIERAVKLSIRD